VASAQNGGGTIASAAELPIGSTFVGGANAVNDADFWRVTLAAGDTLTVDYQPVNGGIVYRDIYKPEVTDFTLGR
jgi:hypothetical protein